MDWGLLCFCHVHTKYCARINIKKNIFGKICLFPFLSWMFSSSINMLGSFARPLFWHVVGRRRKKPLLALLARQGFPNFQEQGVARITFFFSLVYKHFFHPWFLIALAAALKLSVPVEHVSCVEALGGEFSNRPLAKKSVLHVETICQNGFHSLCMQGAQRLPRDVEDMLQAGRKGASQA